MDKLFNTEYLVPIDRKKTLFNAVKSLKGEVSIIYQNIKNECVLYIDDFDKICPKTLKGLKNKCFVGEDWSHLDFNKIFQTIEDRLLYKEIRGHQCILKFKKID